MEELRWIVCDGCKGVTPVHKDHKDVGIIVCGKCGVDLDLKTFIPVESGICKKVK